MTRILLPLLLLTAACAPLVEDRPLHNLADVEAVLGQPAEKRLGAGGEAVYYFPQLPYGRRTFAARVAPNGKLLALEQRLSEEYTSRVVPGHTTLKEVRDLLGPPWRPERYLEREVWTYPMRIAGDPNPKWFIVQMSFDGIVRETYMMNDPQFMQPDSPGRRGG